MKWVLKKGNIMLLSTNRTRHRSRWCGEIMLSLALSAGVAGFLSLVNAIFGQATLSTVRGAPSILIAALAAVIAVFLGLRLASRMGLDRPGPAAALSKAAVVSVIFTVLLAPATLLMHSSAAALGRGEVKAAPPPRHLYRVRTRRSWRLRGVERCRGRVHGTGWHHSVHKLKHQSLCHGTTRHLQRFSDQHDDDPEQVRG